MGSPKGRESSGEVPDRMTSLSRTFEAGSLHVSGVIGSEDATASHFDRRLEANFLLTGPEATE
jgi:hypothetical protein